MIPIYNESALDKIMVFHQLTEPIITEFTDAYI